MRELETKNAVITYTMLGIEDHGIMTFHLMLDYGHSGQSAGGYALDEPIFDENKKFLGREGTAYGLKLIMQVMKVVGVEKWEDLKGKHIRAKADGMKVHAIGHFLEDRWLDFSKFGQE